MLLISEFKKMLSDDGYSSPPLFSIKKFPNFNIFVLQFQEV
jgi:hypothetical protein